MRLTAMTIIARATSTKSVPTSPNSSPRIAKMKSLSALGRYPHFSRLSPGPSPHRPPDASAQVP